MKKKISSILWGSLFVLAGVLVALNVLGVLEFDLFFDGWWTVFIIVPCLVGLFTEKDKMGNLIGLAVGVCLLLGCLDVLSFALLWKLVAPIAIVAVGLKILLGGFKKDKTCQKFEVLEEGERKITQGNAVFSGCELDLNGQPFEGARLVAVFGGVECDLRNAVIEKDCVIKAVAVFGGVDILLPKNVNVKVNSNCFFGGVENEIPAIRGEPTVYIEAFCVFGGAEIKTEKD